MTANAETAKAGTKRRNAPWIYATLVAMTLLAIVMSLVISAPAWMPSHPRLSTPHNFGPMGQTSRDRRDEQLKRLQQYAWQDRSAGVVAIPIDQAIALMIDEAKRPQSTSAKAMDAK